METGWAKAVLSLSSGDDAMVPGGGAIVVRPAEAADASSWDAFVSSHPGATLGHGFGWKRVFESAYRLAAHYLVALEKDKDEVAGVLPLVHMRGLLGGNRLVSLPFLDQAGPLARSAAAGEALWTGALRLARELGVRGIDVRSEAGEGPAPTGRSALVLALPPSVEELWRSFSTKVRNQIRKAEKEGIRTEPAGAGRLDDFYRVFSRNMRDLGSPVHSRRFLETVLDVFGSRATLHLTLERTGRVIGGAIALRAGGKVTVPWASSLRECFASCPNHSLYWQILSGCVHSGADVFDFGRSHDGSGTFHFKRQWGAEPRPLLWAAFDPEGRPASDGALKPGDHTTLTRLWRCVPVTLASFVGPYLRRQLSN
jgi:FemAB-related protein (PEP-CTERM system-associated)